MTPNVTNLNLASILEDSARNYPIKTALIYGEQKYTFAQINGAANQIANALVEIGIGKGDNVALSMLNLPYFPMIYYAILKTGATVVPLTLDRPVSPRISGHQHKCNYQNYFTHLRITIKFLN